MKVMGRSTIRTVDVKADGTDLSSRAGTALLALVAQRLGLADGLCAALTHPGQRPRQRPRQPRLVGNLCQQRAARMRHQPLSIRRHFYREIAAIALHLQGGPP